MTKIAVDIDDTLYSFTDLAREEMYKMALERDDDLIRQAAYAPWTQWRTPPDLLGSLDTWLEIIDRCHTDEQILSRQAFRGAKDVLWKLWQQGHQIKYVSNRREDSDIVTGSWLLMQGLPVATDERVELVCTTADKHRALSDCQYLIDDRPKTLIGFVTDFTWRLTFGSGNKDKKRQAFSLLRPYNDSLSDWPDIYIAPNWLGIDYALEKKGVLSASDDLAPARVS